MFINIGRNLMSRVQLALNVSDIDAAVAFYSKLFNTEPAKRRPGYANFAVTDPSLKLVLIESEQAGSLNHLGIEVETTAEVTTASERLEQAGLATRSEEQVECCYALQSKVWLHDPDGAAWEVYTVLADSSVANSSIQATQIAKTKICCGHGALSQAG
jgi:catechol 2,3-dioxygenase-like lactoylglutathione lyase family enzyme